MRVGSLFSGIGGLDLGFERAGFTTVWMCERNAFRREVLSARFPGAPIYEDVWDLDGSEGEVEALIGGFPCQPASAAGKRRGADDPGWLWPAFERAVRLHRPRYVVVENVKGLLSGGRGFSDVLGSLSKEGYDAEWDVLPAAAFGAPHLRERVFVVAWDSDAHRARREAGATRDRQEVALEEQPGHDALRLRADVPHPDQEHDAGRGPAQGRGAVFEGRGAAPWGTWTAEPRMGRVAYGVPRGVHRLEALGDAVVPQVAEHVARLVLAHDRGP